MKQAKIVARLRDAAASQQQVILYSRVDPDFRVDGYVVQIGEKWALIARTRDGGYFNGHILVRLRSLRNVYPGRSFESTFGRTLPDWPPKPMAHSQTLDLDTTRRMLETSVAPDVLAGFEFENRPGAVNIGRIRTIGRRRFTMLEVDPAAKWQDSVSKWRISRVVALAIGDDYQRSLASVAGPPPE